jgi:hypothetical protein
MGQMTECGKIASLDCRNVFSSFKKLAADCGGSLSTGDNRP